MEYKNKCCKCEKEWVDKIPLSICNGCHNLYYKNRPKAIFGSLNGNMTIDISDEALDEVQRLKIKLGLNEPKKLHKSLPNTINKVWNNKEDDCWNNK